MCRWFAYISNSEPCLLDDVLVRPPHSITKQVNEHYLPKLFHHTTKAEDKIERQDIAARNKFFNEDGTGVGFYSFVQAEYGECTGPRPQLYKTIQPPTNDPNFNALCTNNSSLAVFAHVRMATSSVHLFNNHPFAFGRHLFMHNGAVESFTAIRRQLCAKLTAKAFGNVQGSTDSEHVAALYFSFLGDDWDKTYTLREMKTALDKTISTILTLQAELNDPKMEPSSLNLCTTDGTQLIAVRFRNVKGVDHQPPSLYYSTTAGITLNRKFPGDSAGVHPDGSIKASEEHGKHVIVASEPTTFVPKEWDLIGKNEAILVGADMEIQKEPVPVAYEY